MGQDLFLYLVLDKLGFWFYIFINHSLKKSGFLLKMKEFSSIFSDGSTDVLSQGKNYFAGYSLTYLLKDALGNFAQMQIDSGNGVLYDHRLVDAYTRDHLTPGLIGQYLRLRQVCDISIFVNRKGHIDAEFCWQKQSKI